jgi:hypothetical protein
MKITLLCAFVLSSLYIFTSCTKTNNVTTTNYDTTTLVFKDTVVNKDTVYETTHQNPIVGLWVGTYKVIGGNQADSFYYSFTIDSNNTMITTAIASTSSAASAGPWQLSGTNFTGTVTQLDGGSPVYVQAITAVYDSTGGTLTGQVLPTQGSGLSGTFLLLRVQ